MGWWPLPLFLLAAALLHPDSGRTEGFVQPKENFMELMGIADEGAVTIEGQIEVTKALGWRWIESRFVEV